MAFNPAPSAWLGAGFNQSGDTVVLNTNTAASNKTLPEVTNALADETTGDVRVLFYAFCEAMYNAQQAIDEADRPTRMRIQRRVGGDASGNITRQYSFSFQLTATTLTVTAE